MKKKIGYNRLPTLSIQILYLEHNRTSMIKLFCKIVNVFQGVEKGCTGNKWVDQKYVIHWDLIKTNFSLTLSRDMKFSSLSKPKTNAYLRPYQTSMIEFFDIP